MPLGRSDPTAPTPVLICLLASDYPSAQYTTYAIHTQTCDIKLLAKVSFTREGELHNSVGASGRAVALANSACILAARALPPRKMPPTFLEAEPLNDH